MTSSDGVILATDGLFKAFGGIVAVDVDHLEIEPGRITGLIGPNGAGKTTFFDVVTGFTQAQRGKVTFGTTDVTGRSPYWIARRGLVRTFQLTKALARMLVLENMMLAAPDQSGESLPWIFLRRLHMQRQEARIRKRAEELLERFALAHLRDEYAGRLSGGQKKLLELARALMTQPTMVLLDEPMAGVNPTLGRELLDYVEQLRDEGMTFLIVEHDMDVIMRVSERVIVMAEGKIIADGSPQEVRTDQLVIDAYLGEHAAERIAEAEAAAEPRS